ncbi:WD repeat-containing protein 89-like [Uloborus diversus]|uniref:WD repeat-containing protein 89-like n=1 Tax=Uloborus diversus TaxID=327109 RepID=UPI002409CF47|nr:WD repeat-containing protein 89-like [Uloborus diversus]
MTIRSPKIIPGEFSLAALSTKYEADKEGTYVLHCAVNSENEHAVALSNNLIKVQGKNVLNLTGHQKTITGLKFSSGSPNLLLSSSLDGNVNAWDIRDQNGLVLTFTENSDGDLKPFSSFDFNSDERILCGGTELVREDAFLIFWDVRSTKCLGGYWNSHTDDITQVCFHPFHTSSMATASLDGLINVFNLEEQCEDDALLYTSNAETSISRLCWITDHLSCTTTTEEYQLWSENEASPSFSVCKDDFSSQTKCKTDYFIDTFNIGETNYLATGTNEGTVNIWQNVGSGVKPFLTLANGHTDVVRTIAYSHKGHCVITGGEDSVVCHWRLP